MITLNGYKSLLGTDKIGRIYKKQSDMIEEKKWGTTIDAVTGYLYDWVHDTHQTQLNDLSPEKDEYKIPIDMKFIVNSKQTYSKDPITYHLQLRPSQECNVSYYDKCFKNRYDAAFPCGLYVDIQDSKNRWNRWLIVGEANFNDPQFPTFEILRCDYIINAVIKGEKYNFPVVLRSQNSYNSGIWTDYRVTSVEDQQKFAFPLCREAEKLYYNQRLIIDGKVLTEPRAWHITKINRLAPNGIATVTLAQDHYDIHKDYIEIDPETENVIGMWADYYADPLLPDDYDLQPEKPSEDYGEIVCAGNQEIKVGGSYKKISVNFYDKSGAPVALKTGEWIFEIDGQDFTTELTYGSASEANQIKVKFDSKYGLYIGKVLTIKYIVEETGEIISHEISIVSL